MEEDDIDHNITFPCPGSFQDEDEDDILEEYVVEGDSKEPVVILIGWAGCQNKHLEKYSEIYEKRYITLRYIPPTSITYFKPHLLKTRATKLLDLIFDYSLEENPIFFHIFSNNGSFLYSEISKILTSQEVLDGHKFSSLQVRGVIIDSAPGKRRISNGAWAFATSAVQKGILRYFVYFGMVLYLFVLRLYLFFLHMVKGTQREANPHYIYENMRDDASRWPQLVIYSSADQVILAEDIEEFIQYRKEVFGVPVLSVRFDNSDHVAHLRSNKESYTINCLDFVDRCLGIDKNPEEKQ